MIDRACLSVNNQCNLNCCYCYFRQRNLINSDEMLSEDDISIILHNILGYSRQNGLSMFKMGIVGAGEPLLNFEKIKHIIEYTKREDADNILAFYTVTNGTLVNEEMLLFFHKYKQLIKLNFSLDGHKELHNYGKEKYDKTLNGIKLYESIFHERPVLNCTVSRKTINNKETVARYYIKHNFRNINFSQLIDAEDKDLMINHREYQDFLQYVCDTKAIVFRQGRPKKSYDCLTYGQLCGVGRTNIFITRQGIYPCSRFYKNDAYKIADFNTSFFKIANVLKKFSPVKDGECYYNKHILNRNDL